MEKTGMDLKYPSCLFAMGNNVLKLDHSGIKKCIQFGVTYADCFLCGQQIAHFPIGTIREKDETGEVFDEFADTVILLQVCIIIRVLFPWIRHIHGRGWFHKRLYPFFFGFVCKIIR